MIGGAQIFQELLPRADVLYVTYVHADIGGDTFFPQLSLDDWLEHERPCQSRTKRGHCPA